MKHKFINKKTGAEARVIAMYLDSDGVMQTDGYDAVEDLMDDYAAYEGYTPPKEPLIKNEKVRKAVRAWAEANEVFGASTYKSCSDGDYWYIRAFNDTERGIDIDIWGDLPKELIDCKYYTIAELCGEEEE